jgi:hypothetical protein
MFVIDCTSTVNVLLILLLKNRMIVHCDGDGTSGPILGEVRRFRGHSVAIRRSSQYSKATDHNVQEDRYIDKIATSVYFSADEGLE